MISKMQEFKQNWFLILAAALLGITAVNAIKSGEITPALYKRYSRTKNPIIFWGATCGYVVLAVACLLAILLPQQ